MAQATGLFSSYDAIGNREDLIENIFDVSPTETPFLSAIKKKSATATNHEWQTDALAAAASNAHIEGNDSAAVVNSATTRLSNYSQILKKWAVTSGTQEAVSKAGRKSELGYQLARRMQEMKLDAEFAMLDNGVANGVGNAKVAGNDTTAREMGSLATYLTSNVSVGATGAAASGNSADVMTTGTDRDLTAAILDSVLTTCYTNGADPKMFLVSGTNKGVVSDFTTGGATRYVTTDDKKLTTSVDVYVGDFHTLKVVPCRQLVGDNAYLIDPEYLAVAELRGMKAKDLAVTGDSLRKEITWEITLEVCSEAAQGVIADTNG